jgi:hypothetical protein
MNEMRMCTVEGCTKREKAKGLCAMHYERIRVYGNTYTSQRLLPRKLCTIEGCSNIHVAMGLCAMHYARKLRHGSTDSKLPTYGMGIIWHEQGYKMIRVGDKYVMEHVLLAERALGKSLPEGAVIHHVNGDVTDNYRPFNLIICPNQSYHMLLERRTKELKHRKYPVI